MTDRVSDAHLRTMSFRHMSDADRCNTLLDLREARAALAAEREARTAAETALAEAECYAASAQMITRGHRRMRDAGTKLCEAALRVIRESDGLHRLCIAVAGWATTIADEGDRAACLAADTPATATEGPPGFVLVSVDLARRAMFALRTNGSSEKNAIASDLRDCLTVPPRSTPADTAPDRRHGAGQNGGA